MNERPPSPPLSPGSSLGRFFIRELVGRGRSAIVYRAFDPEQRRDVALKVFSSTLPARPQAAACFDQAAAALQGLRHPALVPILACAHEGDAYYMATDLLRGATLRDLLTAQPAGLPQDKGLDLFRQIAQGVSYMHVHDVAHGNVKPDNIFIRDEQPILTGFGLPCLNATDGGDTDAPDLGSLTYLAPEQVTHHETSPRSDIYTLGIVLYELMTGDVPFRAGTREELTYQHLYATPAPPSQRRVGLDPRIDMVVQRALSKNPRLRYLAIDDLLHDLDQGALEAKYETVVFDKEDAREVRRQQSEKLRNRPASIPSPVPVEMPYAPRPRNVLPLVIGIVAVLIIVAVLAVLLVA
ncbi:serine/threonine-protein kinase [Aggregatilinea lenta]|uniref:serine/threonine-protein kinase n=1 Tax=Aggregatilinea lenta TaxID=913108 RepID=UPI000E5A670E|nr:serine/threonine-protein kinase [Aggregatilinea lenta]